MTLLWQTTTTTVTTTVETNLHVVTDDQLVGMMSAWRTPEPVAADLSDRVTSEVADALTADASDEFHDLLVASSGLHGTDVSERRRDVARRLVEQLTPRVEARVVETTMREVLA